MKAQGGDLADPEARGCDLADPEARGSDLAGPEGTGGSVIETQMSLPAERKPVPNFSATFLPDKRSCTTVSDDGEGSGGLWQAWDVKEAVQEYSKDAKKVRDSAKANFWQHYNSRFQVMV